MTGLTNHRRNTNNKCDTCGTDYPCVVRQTYNEGLANGRAPVYEQDHAGKLADEAYATGYSRGYLDGKTEGYKTGFRRGYNEGKVDRP